MTNCPAVNCRSPSLPPVTTIVDRLESGTGDDDDGRPDLLTSLGSFPHLMKQIFGHLNPEDLCSLSCTSRTCRFLVIDDPQSNRRKDIYIKSLIAMRKAVGLENWPIKRTSSVGPRSETPRGVLGDLTDSIIGNTGPQSPIKNGSIRKAKRTESSNTNFQADHDRASNLSIKAKDFGKEKKAKNLHIDLNEKVDEIDKDTKKPTVKIKLARSESAGSATSRKRLKRL
ncbi:uncharacterized protein LOC141852744 [Brevipalpus obovatus]|uniref:uncharacterized protein LOC141852744 n=1 Tax=Brevipalpus obovatus TaxID=246614 RepID=UPI003D9E382D